MKWIPSGRALRVLALVAVGVYGAELVDHVGAGVGGSDCSGYANSARDILSGRIVVPVEALARLELPDRFARAFMPLAHQPGPRPRTMVPFYPPGFPLHVALGMLLAGPDKGPFLVTPVLAVLCLLLTFVLGRELGLSRPLACAGARFSGSAPSSCFRRSSR